MFSNNKFAAEKVPLVVPLEQKVVKDACRLNSSILPPQVALKLSIVRLPPLEMNLLRNFFSVLSSECSENRVRLNSANVEIIYKGITSC